MKQEEIEEFLKKRTGYLKWGAGKLANHLEADVYLCKNALEKIKKELRQPDVKTPNDNMILKSRWQAQTKEGLVWMESYRNVEDDPTPLTSADWKEIFKEIGSVNQIRITPTRVNKKRTLIIWSSDKHIGAKIPSDSLYKREYNAHIFDYRMVKIYNKIVEYYELYGKFDKIIFADLGDSMDGWFGKTTRGGHDLPQNLSNKEAARVHFFTHRKVFNNIIQSDMSNEVIIWNTTNDNHSGDFGWMANFGLQQYGTLAWPDVKFVNQEEFLGHFELYNKAFITTHGKDKKNRFKGLPLYLDDKTETFLMDYVLHYGLANKKIHVRKGDLHQNVLDCSRKKMSYFNVGSAFGPSDWTMDNFGNGEASCAFEIVEEDGNDIEPKVVWL